MFWYN